jgi:hypothetical protein
MNLNAWEVEFFLSRTSQAYDRIFLTSTFSSSSSWQWAKLKEEEGRKEGEELAVYG